MNTKQKKIIIISAVIAAVIAIAAGVTVYLLDYYPADVEAAMDASPSYCNIIQFGEDLIAFEPDGQAEYGLIFYPGAKIEYTAYEPLLEWLANKGVLCLLVKMPFNLAIFEKNAALGLNMIYPEVEHWYIGGHSLGGAMAADYALESGEYEGVVLLAAYTSKNLSKTDMRVLSVYGSEDGILNRKAYERSKSKLPSDFTEQVIEGGNHSGFAFYGEQKGDGKAAISASDQTKKTAEMIADFIKQKETESTASDGTEESLEN
ncbi:MAG: alpha/beta hydrolase [Oscillospiraceae bacterium]